MFASPKHLAFLCMVFMITGCATPSKQATSETGKRTCLRQIAAEMPLKTQQERQLAYRNCLRSIDERLANASLLEKAQQEKDESEKRLAQQANRQNWASQQERWLHCKSNQNTIIELDRRHTRAYAKLLGAYNRSNHSATEKQDLERELNAIRSEIASAIPEKMRAGKPLIPDSLQTYKRCNSSDFSSAE